MKMQKVTDSFELPKDIVLGLPIVTAYGYNELTIEKPQGYSVIFGQGRNCKGSRQYHKNIRQPP